MFNELNFPFGFVTTVYSAPKFSIRDPVSVVSSHLLEMQPPICQNSAQDQGRGSRNLVKFHTQDEKKLVLVTIRWSD